ncbi:hypothetical protein N9M27_06335 [Flavobacteriales bacterium]|nr:hypothetical protein [Flavobacteriales bacterium]
MRSFLFLLLFPIAGFCQNQQLAENHCEVWIKNRMKDDTNSYNSIFFSKIERIEHISDDGKKLIKELSEEKYRLFEKTIENNAIDYYDSEMKRLDSTIIRIKEEQQFEAGYKLKHKFMAKEATGCRVYYTVNYILNLQLDVLESSSERLVDCANTDF